MCVCVLECVLCRCILCTQVVIEEVEQHQHAATHDHEHTDHDGCDVHRLLVLLLGAVIPLVLHVAPASRQTTGRLTACWNRGSQSLYFTSGRWASLSLVCCCHWFNAVAGLATDNSEDSLNLKI